MPPPSTSRWCLLPARPRSTGLGPVLEPLFRLQVTGIGDRPLPLEPVGGVQLGQQQLVQPVPDAGLLPRPQPPPSRHPAAKAKLLRQVLPADPRVQHEQDPLQHAPVIKRPATRITETPLPRRQQRLDPLPPSGPPTVSPSSTSLPSLTTDADRPFVARLSVNSEAAARAPGAVGNARRKASPCVSTSTPPLSAEASRIAFRCAARASAYCSTPSSVRSDVEPSTSVKTKVTVPAGSSGRVQGSFAGRKQRARRTHRGTLPPLPHAPERCLPRDRVPSRSRQRGWWGPPTRPRRRDDREGAVGTGVCTDPHSRWSRRFADG